MNVLELYATVKLVVMIAWAVLAVAVVVWYAIKEIKLYLKIKKHNT